MDRWINEGWIDKYRNGRTDRWTGYTDKWLNEW